MPEIDFYTVKGININKYFELGLDDDVYYNWDSIIEKIEDSIGCEEDNTKREEMEEKKRSFENVMKWRSEREKCLRRELERLGVPFLAHSYKVRHYVMFGRGLLNHIVREIVKMHYLFEKCDIRRKWEEYKIMRGKQIYTFEEKDRFYEKEYRNARINAIRPQ
jgi:hypothetical protein